MIGQYGLHGLLVSLAPFADELDVTADLRNAIVESESMQAANRWREALLLGLDGDLRGAATVLGEMGSPTLEAKLRLHAGARLLGEGRAEEGEIELRKALSFHRSVEAPHYIQRAEALLAEAHRDSA